jgi:hypothetical protein
LLFLAAESNHSAPELRKLLPKSPKQDKKQAAEEKALHKRRK